jgi:hypothetical protein
VFVELQRASDAPKHVFSMITDMLNLTDQKIKDWSFTYFKDPTIFPLTPENLTSKIIVSPEEYDVKSDTSLGESRLNSLRSLSGVYVKPKMITDNRILEIQRAAGIK